MFRLLLCHRQGDKYKGICVYIYMYTYLIAAADMMLLQVVVIHYY